MRGSWNIEAAGNWAGIAGSGSSGTDIVWQPGGTNGTNRSTNHAGVLALVSAALAAGAPMVTVWFDGSILNEFVFDQPFDDYRLVRFETTPGTVQGGQTAIEIADGASCSYLPLYWGKVSNIVVTKTDGPFCTVAAMTFVMTFLDIGSDIRYIGGTESFVEVEGDGFILFANYARMGEDPTDPPIIKCLADNAGVNLIGREGGFLGPAAVSDGGFDCDIDISVTAGSRLGVQEFLTGPALPHVSIESDTYIGTHSVFGNITPLDANSSQKLEQPSVLYLTTAARMHTLVNPDDWNGREYTVFNAVGSTHMLKIVKHDAGAFGADETTEVRLMPGESARFLAAASSVRIEHISRVSRSETFDNTDDGSTISARTRVLYLDPDAASFGLVLPLLADVPLGKAGEIVAFNTTSEATNTITFTRGGTDTILGGTTYAQQGARSVRTYHPTASGWLVL